MKISQVGINLIKSCEGCRLTAYKDLVGVLTIGYGHTGSVKEGQTITQAQADQLLKDDLAKFEKGVNDLVKVPLTQYQFDALVSFAFNLGCGSLEKSTLLKLLNRGDYAGAANEFERWNKAGGKVYAGLVTRRNAEKALFLQPSPQPATPKHQEVKKQFFYISLGPYGSKEAGQTMIDRLSKAGFRGATIKEGEGVK